MIASPGRGRRRELQRPGQPGNTPTAAASASAGVRPRPRFEAPAVALVFALAAWSSLGALTTTEGGAGAARAALLPPWWVPLAAFVPALAILSFLGRRGVPAWPLTLLALALVPWLPLPAAGALLMWSGPLTAWVWLAAAASWLYLVLGRAQWGPRLRSALGSPRQAPVVAFVLALAILGAAAAHLRSIRPGGDEPHYLVIVQSLLRDGDLRIENNHRDRDYQVYWGGRLNPHYLVRGLDDQIYSVHAPGLPFIVAPAFAAGGYQGVVVLLVLMSALGTLLVWRTAWLLTGSAPAAWFAWATSFSAPFFFHSYAVFPEATGAALVATGVLALVRLELGRPMPPLRLALHGAALAVLPWLHTRYAVLAGVLGGCIAARLLVPVLDRHRAAEAGEGRPAFLPVLAFLAIPVVSAAAWFSFFHAFWGSFNPAAPYGAYTQTSLSNVPRGLSGLLLDQQFGVLANAPVYACSLLGIAWLARRRRRLALELLAVVGFYLAAVSAYHMWWGGWSAPARFAVPALLALGIAGGAYWAEARAAGRAMGVALLGLSLLITGTMTAARSGRLVFNSRDGFARWLDYVAPNVNLPAALPSFFRGSATLAFAQAGAWLLAFAALGLILRALLVRGGAPGRLRPRLALAVPALTAAAIAVAATAGWRLAGAEAVSPLQGQLALLGRYDPQALPYGVTYGAGGREGRLISLVRADAVPPALRLRPAPGRPAAPADSLFSLIGPIPAGVYELVPADAAAARGEAVVRLARGDRHVAAIRFGPRGGGRNPRLDLPAGANGLIVEGDEAARQTVGDLALQPVGLIPPGSRVCRQPARRGAVYGSTTVYCFDDLAYLENPGFWLPGGKEVPLVLSGGRQAERVAVMLRNGAVGNRVVIEGGRWRANLRMAPGEEREIEVPLEGNPPAALMRVRPERGFRPSETEPGNGDARYLGVWIEVRGGG